MSGFSGGADSVLQSASQLALAFLTIWNCTCTISKLPVWGTKIAQVGEETDNRRPMQPA